MQKTKTKSSNNARKALKNTNTSIHRLNKRIIADQQQIKKKEVSQ